MQTMLCYIATVRNPDSHDLVSIVVQWVTMSGEATLVFGAFQRLELEVIGCFVITFLAIFELH